MPKDTTSKYLPIAILFFIVSISIGIRVSNLSGVPFQNGDDISVAWASIWYFPRDWNVFRIGDASISPNPIGIITLSHGPLQPLIAIPWVSLLDGLGFRITEAAWHLPFAILGALVAVAAFLYGKGFHGMRAGIICAAMAAFIPLHVLFSRTSGESHFVLAALFQLVSISAWWRYLNTRNRKYALVAGIAFGLDTMVDFWFIGLGVVLGILAWLRYGEGSNQGERLRSSFAAILHPALLLPAIAGLSFHIITVLLTLRSGSPIGMLGRVLTESSSSHTSLLGFFWNSALLNLYHTTNSAFLFLAVILLILYFRIAPLRTIGATISLIWFLVYLAPFLLIIERSRLVGHFIPIAVAAAMFCALVLNSLLNTRTPLRRSITYTLIVAVVASLLITSISGVFGVKVPGWLTHPGDHGAIGSNRGTRTAAYWIRHETDRSSVIFADPFASQDEPIGLYYYQRPTIGMALDADASIESAAALLRNNLQGLDILVIGVENRALLLEDIPDIFRLVAVVNVNGIPSLEILQRSTHLRNEPAHVQHLDAEVFDKAFLEEFTILRDIINLPLETIQQNQIYSEEMSD